MHDGWGTYFEEAESVCENEGRREVVRKLARFFSNSPIGHEVLLGMTTGAQGPTVPVNFELLNANAGVRGLEGALRDDPHEALSCIALAMARAAEEIKYNRAHEHASRVWLPPVGARITPRMTHFPRTRLAELRSHRHAQFFALRGTVTRCSSVLLQCKGMQFKCHKCLDSLWQSFDNYLFTQPESCPTDGCRSRTFQPVAGSEMLVDWQRLKVQEILDEEELADAEIGRIPRSLTVEVAGDLVRSCTPGDVVQVAGIVRLLGVDADAPTGKKQGLYDIYLEANSILNQRSAERTADANRDQSQKLDLDLSLTQQEERQYLALRHSHRDLFAQLVSSLCPTIFGHEMVKAGLLLALFGGSVGGEQSADKDRVSVRTSIHCLLVGDPGLGKSQMLRSVSSLTPRGVFVSGNSSTTAGLTVMVGRDGVTGEFALEAGALVLADESVCCIDEFDKMSADLSSLLEPMEQQSVSVAKAGILATLSARTSVIAAANPAFGHYHSGKSVVENLKIPSPVLSRFDLIFIMLDEPDKRRDQLVSAHVAARFGQPSATQPSFKRSRLDRSPMRRNVDPKVVRVGAEAATSLTTTAPSQPLSQRLADYECTAGGEGRALNPAFLRGYIAYARRHVHPKLSHNAKVLLKQYWLGLRDASRKEMSHSEISTPVTTRQLESIVRLAQARARSEFRTVVTARDAEDVIEITQYAKRAFDPQFGACGLDSNGNKRAPGKGKKVRWFVDALRQQVALRESTLFEVDELKVIAERLGVVNSAFHEVLENVNHQGFLLKKGRDAYVFQDS
ncbi:DNA helicase MCM8 [Porphyridium purpureum]|uniref:Minichromosome maintenance 8 n=1 Tax=Porphyridium purpureum TaxID=35688 RepID=A0A5J4Z9F6_PORPP|nr:DNA helicase MCM8 [Porphyridium purpureum]|eukprot:POR7752..scf295_1